MNVPSASSSVSFTILAFILTFRFLFFYFRLPSVLNQPFRLQTIYLTWHWLCPFNFYVSSAIFAFEFIFRAIGCGVGCAMCASRYRNDQQLELIFCSFFIWLFSYTLYTFVCFQVQLSLGPIKRYAKWCEPCEETTQPVCSHGLGQMDGQLGILYLMATNQRWVASVECSRSSSEQHWRESFVKRERKE